ncbi:MAG: DUF2490 domain-containing protein [Chitinophagales bacterium]
MLYLGQSIFLIRIKTYLVGWLLLITNIGLAQSSYELGLLPSINVSKSFEKDWKLSFKGESRQSLKSGAFSEGNSNSYNYLLTDFIVFTSKKIAPNKALAFGYTFRIQDRSTIKNRITQQFSAAKAYSSLKLGHRLRTDETFSKNEPIELRLRYQLSIEVPFKPKSVEPNGFYYKLGNEYVTSLKAKTFDLELRLVNLIGYEFSSKSKLEWGVDYRASSFIHDELDNAFWMAVKWYWTM